MIKPIIYVRAGHSGIDPKTGLYLTKEDSNSKWYDHKNGKTYHKGSQFFEGESNRDIAAEFIKQATASRFHVVPIHHPYLDFSLGEYCDEANAHAKKHTTPSSPAIFLDIHSNASGSGKARGMTTLYYPGYIDKNTGLAVDRPSRGGKLLAESMSSCVNPLFLEYGSDYKQSVRPGWMYKGNKPYAVYYMLQNTNMPSIIIENGFFDNEKDADLLMNHEFCVELVAQMVRGVQRYFNNL